MPTDGADFGRMKACYGKAYSAARSGADASEVASIVVLGVERDIRRDGGAPAFGPAVDFLVLAAQSSAENRCNQLLTGVDMLNREYADSPLTRYVADAAAHIGVTCINEGFALSRQIAAERLIAHLARSRCCEGMSPYLTRNLTQSASSSRAIVSYVDAEISKKDSLRDLAARMLNGSPKGLPAKAQKAIPITHSAAALNDEVIGGG